MESFSSDSLADLVAMRTILGQTVQATGPERAARLPGDDLIPDSVGSLTHAITIRAFPSEIWPWLVQMGAGRAGWYSYDRLDNRGQPSADRIVPERQALDIGTLMPTLPGIREGFTVRAFEFPHFLVLGWGDEQAATRTTWAFVLEPLGRGQTRLIVRARATAGYRLFGLPPAMSRALVVPVHWIMQRKQLVTLKRRIEEWASRRPSEDH